MDQIRQKMTNLREAQERTQAENDDLKKEIKKMDDHKTSWENDVKSLSAQIAVLADKNERLEAELKEAKAASGESDKLRQDNDILQSRLQTLEDESAASDTNNSNLTKSLSQHAIQVENLQRDNLSLMGKLDEMERKKDGIEENLKKVTKELEDFQVEIGSI